MSTNVKAQSRARILRTYSVFAQVASRVKTINYVSAQSQVKIINMQYAQSQADIEKTGNTYAQSQVRIKVTSYVSAQSRTLIINKQYAQSQADIEKTGNYFSQSRARIKTANYVSAQSQASSEFQFTVFSESSDQYVATQSSTYATARTGPSAGASMSSVSSATAPMGQARDYGPFNVYELMLSFDTSGVPEGAIVTDVLLSLNGSFAPHGAVAAIILEARLYDFGTSVETSDWVPGENLNTLPLLAHLNIASNLSDWVNASYNDFTGDSFVTNINTTGKTRMLVTTDQVRLGNAPANGEIQYAVARLSEMGIPYKPKLTITYTYPTQVCAQSQVDVVITSSISAQSQVYIEETDLVQAQSQASVVVSIATDNIFAQSLADILVTNTEYSQSCGQIMATYAGFAQSAAGITSTDVGYSQSQVSIIQNWAYFAQSQSGIVQTSVGYAQSQVNIIETEIEQIISMVAQSQSQIIIVTYIRTSLAQSQVDIKQTYPLPCVPSDSLVGEIQLGTEELGGTSGICGGPFGQSCTYISVTNHSTGQSQTIVLISTVTKSVFAQSKAIIRNIQQVCAQSQVSIYIRSSVVAQSNVDIQLTSLKSGQSQVSIKTLCIRSSQERALIKDTYLETAQSQVRIVYTALIVGAQSQATIEQTYYAQTQSGARVLATTSKFAESQTDVKTCGIIAEAQSLANVRIVSRVSAQSQALILATINACAKSQAWVKIEAITITAQSQAWILKSKGISQSRTFIHILHTLKDLEITDSGAFNLYLESTQEQETITTDIEFTLNISNRISDLDLLITDKESMTLTIQDMEYL